VLRATPYIGMPAAPDHQWTRLNLWVVFLNIKVRDGYRSLIDFFSMAYTNN